MVGCPGVGPNTLHERSIRCSAHALIEERSRTISCMSLIRWSSWRASAAARRCTEWGGALVNGIHIYLWCGQAIGLLCQSKRLNRYFRFASTIYWWRHTHRLGLRLVFGDWRTSWGALGLYLGVLARLQECRHTSFQSWGCCSTQSPCMGLNRSVNSCRGKT